MATALGKIETQFFAYVQMRGQQTVRTGEVVRSLVDAVYDWSRFNSLPQGYDWIRAELGQAPTIAREIARVAMRYGNVGTLRRLDRLLEREAAAPALLRSLASRLSPSSALIPWLPTLPKRGTVDRRWGVVVNDDS